MKKIMTCIAAAVVSLSLPAKAQEQTDLQRIIENKVVRIGAPIADPYYIQEPGSDEWTGVVPDVARMIFGGIGVEVVFVPTEWGTAIAGLQADRFDLMGAFDATPERGLAVDFTEPMGSLDTGILTLAGDGAKYANWEDIAKSGARIATVDGASPLLAARTMLPDANWVLVPKWEDAFLQLESGRADIVLAAAITLARFVERRGKGEVVLPKPLVGVPTNFALKKSNPSELKNWLDLTLAYYERRNQIAPIWRKYTEKLGVKY